MRIYLFIIFIASGLIVKSQKVEYTKPNVPIDSSTNLITYTKVIDITASKDSLYNKVKKWYFEYFKNPTGVIRHDDAINGIIEGKHQIKVLQPPDKKGVQTMRGIVQYTIKTMMKDNKVKIILTEFNLRQTSYTPIENWLNEKAPDFTISNYYYLQQIDNEMNQLIQNFTNFLFKKSNNKAQDW